MRTKNRWSKQVYGLIPSHLFSGMETETLPSVCVFPCCFSEESFRDGRKTKKNTSTGLEKFVPLIHALHPLGFFLLGTSVKPRGGKPLRPQTKLRAHGQCSDKCMPERIQLEANWIRSKKDFVTIQTTYINNIVYIWVYIYSILYTLCTVYVQFQFSTASFLHNQTVKGGEPRPGKRTNMQARGKQQAN